MTGKFQEISVVNLLRLLPPHDGRPEVKYRKLEWLEQGETSLYDLFVRLSSLLTNTWSNCPGDPTYETLPQ